MEKWWGCTGTCCKIFENIFNLSDGSHEKEENFFDKAEAEIISKEEEFEMYEQFKSVMTVSKKMEEMIKEIEYLENQNWVKN